MLGDVQVNVVFLESSAASQDIGFLNDNSETWTQASIDATKAKVEEGLQWWVDTLAGITHKHHLQFHIDFTHADSPFVTRYEPIIRPSTDNQHWAGEFFRSEGYNSGFLFTDVKEYNNAQRVANDANWSFTIFVVNDLNDGDHKFAAGGLDRSFAFPGGLFLVTLASRPASSIAHETGHQFWALDEYQFGGTYTESRGYYDSPNSNAWNNPTPNYQRQPSIMDRGACDEGGGLLCTAYQQHTSSDSSLALIGWQDSDGDGVFDVLDVPHTLSGSGYYDASTQRYRFTGSSTVQTLANLNPREQQLPTESLQSDITINKISRAQYRVDGGEWQTAAVYGTYSAALDLSIGVPATAQQIEIRTIDDTTGITSPVFTGTLDHPAAVTLAGINGFVFEDANDNGQFENGESGVAGQTVQLVNAAGQPLTLQTQLEPDNYTANQAIGATLPSVRVTAAGDAVSGPAVYARSATHAATGTQVFGVCSFTQGNNVCSTYATEFTSSTRQLRIDFTTPVTTVSLDAVSNSTADYGRLEIYDANDNLLARYTTQALAAGAHETMTLSRPTADIAYAIAKGYADTAVQFDNLRFGPQSSAITDAQGVFVLPYLLAGTYRVKVVPAAGNQVSGNDTQTISITANEARSSVDFGVTAMVSAWQNPSNRYDVNNDTFVSPIDVLQVINDISERGARALTNATTVPPYVDVNGDSFVSPIDVLQVINAIGDSQSEGEASTIEMTSATDTSLFLSAQAEGEGSGTDGGEIQVARSGESATFSDQIAARPTHAYAYESPANPVLRSIAARRLLRAGEWDELLDSLATDVAANWRSA